MNLPKILGQNLQLKTIDFQSKYHRSMKDILTFLPVFTIAISFAGVTERAAS